jgi:hypothetical protein
MDPRQLGRSALIALPALVLAVAGTVHPAHLTAGTAQWWSTLHVLLLPVFPLLGAALWVSFTGAPAALRWPGRLAAFCFAVYYTGLDAVAGIAAGAAVHAQHGRGGAEGAVIAIGDKLGHAGAWAFLIAGLALTLARVRRAGWPALPGGVLLLASGVSFLDSHIFWPRGVVTMLGIALGLFSLNADLEARSRRPGGAGAPPAGLSQSVGLS